MDKKPQREYFIKICICFKVNIWTVAGGLRYLVVKTLCNGVSVLKMGQ